MKNNIPARQFPEFFQQGQDDFSQGKMRICTLDYITPDYIKKAEAWFLGWDYANLKGKP